MIDLAEYESDQVSAYEIRGERTGFSVTLNPQRNHAPSAAPIPTLKNP